mgnify:CR=1 FL=1
MVKNMSDDDYMALLSRARESLPEEIADHDRFQVPEPEVLVEGNNTVIRNFVEISKSLNREPEEFFTYLQREVGTAGSLEGQRVIFKGKIQKSLLETRIRSFINNFVLCSECGKPDTHMEKEGRILILRCEACGAFRPVKVKKGNRTQEREGLSEGLVIEVHIQDVGRRGDGIAKVGDYTIFVPGSVKGETINIKIDKVRGNMAFAHPERAG